MHRYKSTIFSALLIYLFLGSCADNTMEPEQFTSFDWPESSPQEEGVDPQIIASAFDEAGNRSFINGIVIIRNGNLIAERYYNGFNKNDYHNIRSVSKSILSALIGIAIDEGYIPDTQKKMMDYFTEYNNAGIDSRMYQVTIENLLTQRSGIDTDHNNYIIIFSSNNWIKTTLELPLIANPGEEFNYTTAGTHLLSVLLTKAGEMSSWAFARKYLTNPLGISIAKWERDPLGYYTGGNNMYISPRDLARFGYLFLNSGRINNDQVIPEHWVSMSLTDYQNHEEWNWGDLTNIGYGYLWWMGDISGYHAKIALGHGGQFIILIAELQLIITTSSYSDNLSWDAADIQERSVLDIVANYILPAVIQ